MSNSKNDSMITKENVLELISMINENIDKLSAISVNRLRKYFRKDEIEEPWDNLNAIHFLMEDEKKYEVEYWAISRILFILTTGQNKLRTCYTCYKRVTMECDCRGVDTVFHILKATNIYELYAEIQKFIGFADDMKEFLQSSMNMYFSQLASKSNE